MSPILRVLLLADLPGLLVLIMARRAVRLEMVFINLTEVHVGLHQLTPSAYAMTFVADQTDVIETTCLAKVSLRSIVIDGHDET
jgi:hypothetical protein